MAVRCTNCKTLYLPPRSLCPRCYTTDMEWFECSGQGKLSGFSIVYTGLPAMIARGHNRANPYIAGVVQLAEGPIINAQILDHDSDNIQVGIPLQLAFIKPQGENESDLAIAFKTAEGG